MDDWWGDAVGRWQRTWRRELEVKILLLRIVLQKQADCVGGLVSVFNRIGRINRSLYSLVSCHMSAANTWTISHLMRCAIEYGSACSRRNRKLVISSGALLVATFVSVLIAPRLFIVPLAGLVGLMVYILVTCHRWHRQHGVFCPHCSRSLVELNDELEEIFLDASAPETLLCPSCDLTFKRLVPAAIAHVAVRRVRPQHRR